MTAYTDEQKSVIGGSVVLKKGQAQKVLAFAGAGKTTTLKGVAAERGDKIAYLAFNREIAREAQQKFRNTSTSASTMHSLAMKAVRHRMSEPPLSSVSAREILESASFRKAKFPFLKGWHEFRVALAVGRTMIQFAQSDDLEFKTKHAQLALIATLGDPDLMKAGLKKRQVSEAIQKLSKPLVGVARDFWVGMEKEGRYTHDMYLKRLHWSPKSRALAFEGFDALMVDEAQDINPVQRAILTQTGLPLIAVGDPYQQIYSWRGAENALTKLPGKAFHLTQSFRFAENIAAPARGILASRPDGGPRHKLIGAGSGNGGGHTGIPWAIICRTNIGVIDAALDLLDEGYPMRIDNIDGLLKDLRSAEALYADEMDKVETPELKMYNSWDELKEEAEDGNQTLKKIVSLVERRRVGAVSKLSKADKNGEEPRVFLCTAHRSKGLEFPRVTLGQDWKPLSQMKKRFEDAKAGPQKTMALEEWNTLYVAATRAMVSLENLDELMQG